MNLPREATLQAPVFSQPANPRRDWSDYAHPCLLLEMRRGVRTSLFVLCFLGLHLLVMGALLAQLLTPDMYATAGRGGWEFLISIMFWLCVIPPFIIALPFTSLFTLSQDIHLQTIETILMTRLGPLGIVLGKWSSKALESVLMACTLLPYTVLRYYMFGTNPILDTTHLVSLVFISSFMCSMGVALSTVKSVIMRVVAAIMVACCFYPILQMGITEVVTRSIGPGIVYGLYSMPYLIGLICILGTVAAIGIAASEVGPPAYNGTMIARVVALLMVLPWAVGAYCGMPAEIIVALQVSVGLMLFIPMMLEESGHSEHEGQRPCVIRAAATPSLWKAVTLPGWQASVWWIAVAMFLWVVPLAVSDSFSLGPRSTGPGAFGFNGGLEVACYVAAPCVGALMFPFVLIRAIGTLGIKKGLFAIRPVTAFIYFIVIIMVCVALSIMLYVLEPTLPGVFFFMPPVQLSGLMMNGSSMRPQEGLIYLSGMWPVLVLLGAGIREHQLMMQKAARSSLITPMLAQPEPAPGNGLPDLSFPINHHQKEDGA